MLRSYLSGVLISAFLLCNIVLAESPPFSSITMTGETRDIYNKVSIFKSAPKTPDKTENISAGNGRYRIDIDIPADMRKKDDYYFADMRFWQDKNDNGIIDRGESLSRCHFIIWVPSDNKIYLQVYKGPKYEINSSNYTYDYKN